MRIGSIIIFHLSNLWKAKFFILCDVIIYFWLGSRGNLKFITPGRKSVITPTNFWTDVGTFQHCNWGFKSTWCNHTNGEPIQELLTTFKHYQAFSKPPAHHEEGLGEVDKYGWQEVPKTKLHVGCEKALFNIVFATLVWVPCMTWSACLVLLSPSTDIETLKNCSVSSLWCSDENRVRKLQHFVVCQCVAHNWSDTEVAWFICHT